ncbi:MAG: hypothetical protein WBC99_03980, partial [Candidatus Omnitrophota bacterium]
AIDRQVLEREAAEKELARLGRLRTERYPVALKAKTNTQKAECHTKINELTGRIQRQQELLKVREQEASGRIKTAKKIRKAIERAARKAEGSDDPEEAEEAEEAEDEWLK